MTTNLIPSRLCIAAELGLDHESVRFDMRSGLSEEDKLSLCRRLNDVRRQLTPEEVAVRRERKRVMNCELGAQGKSTRVVAEATGTPVTTVQRDLCSTVPPGTVEQPERKTGRDGKSRPAKARPVPLGAQGVSHSPHVFRWRSIAASRRSTKER